MTIRELKDIIDSIDEEDLDQGVYMLQQPNWPFTYSVSQADYIPAGAFEEPEEGEEEDFEHPHDYYSDEDKRPGLYLAEGRQLAYAGSVELDYFGWR